MEIARAHERSRRAHDRDKEPDIRLCQCIADEIVLAGQHLLEAVQTVKERVHRLVVRLLRSREPGLVYAIWKKSGRDQLNERWAYRKETLRTVHGIVHPCVDRVDLLAVLLRVDIDGRFFGGKQVVEGGVEDADDVGAFVVDDRVRLLVPENRDGEPCERGG